MNSTPKQAAQAAKPAGQDLYPTVSSFDLSDSTRAAMVKAGHNPKAALATLQKAHESGDYYTKAQTLEQLAGWTDFVNGGSVGQSFLDNNRLQTREEQTPTYNSVSGKQAFFGSIGNGLSQIVEAVPKLGVAAAGLTGAIDNDQWRRANKGIEETMSGMKTYVSDNYMKGLASYDEQNGVQVNLDMDSFLGTTGNLVSYILPGLLTMGSASLATMGARGLLRTAVTAAERQGAINTLETAATYASRATSASAFLQTFPDYQREALAAGYSPTEATLYALPVAAINAGIETMNMGALAKAMGVSPAAARSALRRASLDEAAHALTNSSGRLTADMLVETGERVAKSSLELIRHPERLVGQARMAAARGLAGRAARRIGRGFVEQGIPEGGEEFFQGLVENMSKSIFKNLQAHDSSGQFEDPSFGKYVFDSVYGTFLGAVVGTVPGVVFQQRQVDPTIFGYVGTNVRTGMARGLSPEEMLDPASSNRLEILNILDDKLNRGELDPAKHKELQGKVARMAHIATDFADVDAFSESDQYTMFAVGESRFGLAERRAQLDAQKNELATLTQAANDPNATMGERIKAEMASAQAERNLGGMVDTGEGPMFAADVQLAQRQAETDDIINQTLKLFEDPDQDRKAIATFAQDNLAKINRDYAPQEYPDSFKPTRLVTDATGRLLVTNQGEKIFRELQRQEGKVTAPAMLDADGNYVPAQREKTVDTWSQPLTKLDDHLAVAQALADPASPVQSERYVQPDNSAKWGLIQDGVQLATDLETLSNGKAKGKIKTLEKTRALAQAYLTHSMPLLDADATWGDAYAKLVGRIAPLLGVQEDTDADPVGGDVDLLSLENGSGNASTEPATTSAPSAPTLNELPPPPPLPPATSAYEGEVPETVSDEDWRAYQGGSLVGRVREGINQKNQTGTPLSSRENRIYQAQPGLFTTRNSGTPATTTAPAPQSAPAAPVVAQGPAGPAKYAATVDTGSSFSPEYLSDQPAANKPYRIVQTGPDAAEFYINPDATEYAKSDPYGILADGWIFAGPTVANANRLTTIKPGTLRREGNKWAVVTKGELGADNVNPTPTNAQTPTTPISVADRLPGATLQPPTQQPGYAEELQRSAANESSFDAGERLQEAAEDLSRLAGTPVGSNPESDQQLLDALDREIAATRAAIESTAPQSEPQPADSGITETAGRRKPPTKRVKRGSFASTFNPVDAHTAILQYFAQRGKIRRPDLVRFVGESALRGPGGGDIYMNYHDNVKLTDPSQIARHYLAKESKAPVPVDQLGDLLWERLGHDHETRPEELEQQIIDTVMSFSNGQTPTIQLQNYAVSAEERQQAEDEAALADALDELSPEERALWEAQPEALEALEQQAVEAVDQFSPDERERLIDALVENGHWTPGGDFDWDEYGNDRMAYKTGFLDFGQAGYDLYERFFEQLVMGRESVYNSLLDDVRTRINSASQNAPASTTQGNTVVAAETGTTEAGPAERPGPDARAAERPTVETIEPVLARLETQSAAQQEVTPPVEAAPQSTPTVDEQVADRQSDDSFPPAPPVDLFAEQIDQVQADIVAAISNEAITIPAAAAATVAADAELATLQKQIEAADRNIARLQRENSKRVQTGDLFNANPAARTQSDLFAGETTGLDATRAAADAVAQQRQARTALVEQQRQAQDRKVKAIEQAVDADQQQGKLFDQAQPLTPEQQRIADIKAKKAANSAAMAALMRGKLNAGIDPELLRLGLENMALSVELGLIKFKAFLSDFMNDIGTSELTEDQLGTMKIVYGAYRTSASKELRRQMDTDDQLDDITLSDVNNQPNDAGTPNGVESGSSRTEATQPVGADNVQPANSERAEPGVGQGIQLVERPGQQSTDNLGVSENAAPAGGASRANPIYQSDGKVRPADSDTRSDDSSGSSETSDPGVQPDRIGEQRAIQAAQERGFLTYAEKLALQQQAESIEVVVGNRANIDATLPFLMDGQREDVQFAEARLSKPDGYGVLFTNGTGTGKTFLGLGIIKRFAKQGKGSALVIVPNTSVMNEWTKSAPALGLTIRALDDMKDAGEGINVTTYANFAGNEALTGRQFDLLLADEAHNLMQSSSADVTGALKAFRVHTYHAESSWERTRMEHNGLFMRLMEVRSRIRALSDLMANQDRMAEQVQEWQREQDELDEERSLKQREYDNYLQANDELVKSKQGATRPRAVFLSATPFAYRETVQWANGYLFNYGKSDSSSYNIPSGYEAFMVQHFGYRMRYNRLTQPEVGVDVSLMERNFNGWLQKQGVASARVLDIDSDYQRLFALTPSAVGTLIDEGLEFVRNGDDKRYVGLIEILEKRFNYLQRQRLLEAIKANEAIPYIQQWIDQGKKVVVFYDYTEGGGFAPFHFEDERGELPHGHIMTGPYGSQKSVLARDLIREFYKRRPDLYAINAGDYGAPLETLGEAFPQAAKLKGGMSKTAKTATVKNFNDDTKPGSNIILVNAAANAGWSGHDTTGRHPRVLVNLGLPTQPTRSIQQEGRIYRTGQHPESNSMFVYFNTGTNWERRAFADTIAGRAGTAENLGMGEMARGLKQAFVEGFEQTAEYTPSEKDGTGGKVFDRSFTKPISEWEKAKTYYFSQLKRTAKTKAYEGVDYFATPEPLGLKMVQWGDIKNGDRVNEPSAGHGAIARFVPEDASLTVIEPSSELYSRVSLVTDGRKLNEAYENHNPVNKYQVTLMNPPYGQAGKTAMEHVAKAMDQHSVVGSRVVALVPVGAFNTKFDKWLAETNAPPKTGRQLSQVYVRARVLLPGSTFGRAGTGVNTQVLVLDKLLPGQNPGPTEEIDLRDVKDVDELFGELETLYLPERIEVDPADVLRVSRGDLSSRGSVLPIRPTTPPITQNGPSVAQNSPSVTQNGPSVTQNAVPVAPPVSAPVQPSPVLNANSGQLGQLGQSERVAVEPKVLEPVATKHTRNNTDIFVVQTAARVDKNEFNAIRDEATAAGGYYSSFRGEGAIPGFIFSTQAAADAFYRKINEVDEVASELDQESETPAPPVAPKPATVAPSNSLFSQLNKPVERWVNADGSRLFASLSLANMTRDRLQRAQPDESFRVERVAGIQVQGDQFRIDTKIQQSPETSANTPFYAYDGKAWKRIAEQAPFVVDEVGGKATYVFAQEPNTRYFREEAGAADASILYAEDAALGPKYQRERDNLLTQARQAYQQRNAAGGMTNLLAGSLGDNPAFQLAEPGERAATSAEKTEIQQVATRLSEAMKVPVVADPAAFQQALVEANAAGLVGKQQVKAFRWKGTVYLSPDATLDTPFHEFAGVWAEAARTQFPALFQKGLALVRDSVYYKKLRLNQYYRTLGPAAMEVEAVEQAIGDKGAQFAAEGRRSSFRLWMDEFFAKVGNVLGLVDAKGLADAKLSRWAGQVLSQMESGRVQQAPDAAANTVPSFQLAENENPMAGQPDPGDSTIEAPQPTPDDILGQTPENMDALRARAEAAYRNPETFPVTNADRGAVTDSPTVTASADLFDKSANLFTNTDKAFIGQVTAQTGWRLVGSGVMELEKKGDLFHTAGGKVVQIGPSALAQTIAQGFGQIYSDPSYRGRLMKGVIDHMKTWTNLTAFVDALDDAKGTLDKLIRQPQLEGMRRAGHAKSVLQDKRQIAQEKLANFVDQTIDVESYDFDPATGSVIRVTKTLPMITAMEAVGLAETQLGNTPNGESTHVFENEPRPNELYDEENGIRTRKLDHGAQFYDVERERTDVLMLPKDEFLRLLDRFVDGEDAMTGEVEGYEALLDFFNTNEVADMLEVEQKALNPDREFVRVGERTGGPSPRLAQDAPVPGDPGPRSSGARWYAEALERREELRKKTNPTPRRKTLYYPIRTTGPDANARLEAQGRIQIFDEKGVLKGRSVASKGIILANGLQTMLRYEQVVGDLLEYGRLSNNLMNLRDAIKNRYDGPAKGTLVKYLEQRTEDLANYRQKMADVRARNPGLTSLERGMQRFTTSIFGLNLGLPAKQLGTALSAMGQGIIDNVHLRNPAALSVLAKLTGGAYKDAGVTANIKTDGSEEGLTGGLLVKGDTTERPFVEELLGKGMDEAGRQKQLQRFGAVINRLLDSNNRYVGDVTFDDLGLNKATLTKAQKLLQKYDQFAGDRLLSAMKRADRAPVFYYMAAAKLQASAEGLQEGTDAWWDRVADLSERVLSETYNTDNLAERTPMQLSEQFLVRMIGMYSSQQQKIANLLIKSVVEYAKAPSGTPQAKAARAKLLSTLGYGVITNAIYVAAVTAGTSVVMALLSGGEPPEGEELIAAVEDGAIRNVVGTFPGLGSMAAEYILNSTDAIHGNEEFVEITAMQNLQTGLDAVVAAGRYMNAEDEKKEDKAADTFVRKSTDFIAKSVGLPTSAVRVARDRIMSDD